MAAAGRKLILDGPLISTIYPKPCFDMNPWHVKNIASTYVRRSDTKPTYKGVVWVPPSQPKVVGLPDNNEKILCFLILLIYNSSKGTTMMAASANFLHTSQRNTLTSFELCEVPENPKCSILRYNRRACTPHQLWTQMWISESMLRTGAHFNQLHTSSTALQINEWFILFCGRWKKKIVMNTQNITYKCIS